MKSIHGLDVGEVDAHNTHYGIGNMEMGWGKGRKMDLLLTGIGIGSQTQKGIAAYTLSSNRQRPFAGALNAAIFNTWRRTKNQILYVLPPFVIAYSLMQWAIERCVLLASHMLERLC